MRAQEIVMLREFLSKEQHEDLNSDVQDPYKNLGTAGYPSAVDTDTGLQECAS